MARHHCSGGAGATKVHRPTLHGLDRHMSKDADSPVTIVSFQMYMFIYIVIPMVLQPSWRSESIQFTDR